MRSFSYILILLLIIGMPAYAQLGYGPELGLGMSSMHFVPAEGFTSAQVKPIVSGRIGGIVDLGINNKMFLQSGLFLSRKGQTRDFSFYASSTFNESVHQTLSINYIDLPLNVLYKSGTQGKGRVILGAGVTASYIIGGRNKLEITGDSGSAYSSKIDSKIQSGNPVALFDIGVNVTGGYELPTGLFFKAYYTAGVKDIGLGTETDKNRIWGIAAGYIFGKGRNINKEAADLIDRSTD